MINLAVPGLLGSPDRGSFRGLLSLHAHGRLQANFHAVLSDGPHSRDLLVPDEDGEK